MNLDFVYIPSLIWFYSMMRKNTLIHSLNYFISIFNFYLIFLLHSIERHGITICQNSSHSKIFSNDCLNHETYTFYIILHFAENIYFEETTALGYTKYDATLKAHNLRMWFEFKLWFLFATYLFVLKHFTFMLQSHHPSLNFLEQLENILIKAEYHRFWI